MRQAGTLMLLGALASCRAPSRKPAGDETKKPEPFGFVSPIAEMRHRAGEAFEQKRYEDAVDLRKKVIEMLPEGHYEREYEWGQIARCYQEAAKTGEMIQAWIHAGWYFRAAEELAQLGRLEQAAGQIMKVGDRVGEPTDLLRAARYYRKAGNTERASEVEMTVEAMSSPQSPFMTSRKLAVMLHDALNAGRLETSVELAERIKQTLAQRFWPLEELARVADLLRWELKREEAIAYLESLLETAPNHRESPNVLLKLAEHVRMRNPDLYEEYLLKAAFHPLEAGLHFAQQRAKAELAIYYEAAGRFKDGARILERLIHMSGCGVGAAGTELGLRLRALDLKRHFMEKEKVLRAIWQEAKQSPVASPMQPAYYIARAYDSENRAEELRRLAHMFADETRRRVEDSPSKEGKHAEFLASYAQHLLADIEQELRWRRALKGDADVVVAELTEIDQEGPLSYSRPLSPWWLRGPGAELIAALRRFPKETVAPILARAFENDRTNRWITIAMAENRRSVLMASLVAAAKSTVDVVDAKPYIDAIAYSADPGSEDMLRDVARTRHDLKWLVGEALAHLADVREREAAER